MKKDTVAMGGDEAGATVVITHRVRQGKADEYEQWLDEIKPVGNASAGNLDWHVIRPVPGLTSTYTVIIRFDTQAHLRAWMESPARTRLIKKSSLCSSAETIFLSSSGLDFWFTPEGAKAKVLVRWRQYLVTWSAIYPLAVLVPLAVAPVLRLRGAPGHRYLTMLAVTGVVTFLMVYVVMPRYTKLIRRWLFT